MRGSMMVALQEVESCETLATERRATTSRQIESLEQQAWRSTSDVASLQDELDEMSSQLDLCERATAFSQQAFAHQGERHQHDMDRLSEQYHSTRTHLLDTKGQLAACESSSHRKEQSWLLERATLQNDAGRLSKQMEAARDQVAELGTELHECVTNTVNNRTSLETETESLHRRIQGMSERSSSLQENYNSLQTQVEILTRQLQESEIIRLQQEKAIDQRIKVAIDEARLEAASRFKNVESQHTACLEGNLDNRSQIDLCQSKLRHSQGLLLEARKVMFQKWYDTRHHQRRQQAQFGAEVAWVQRWFEAVVDALCHYCWLF